MAQSRTPAQAEGSVPRVLVVECAWCNEEAGYAGTLGATHTICYQHLRRVRRLIHERRERIERLR